MAVHQGSPQLSRGPVPRRFPRIPARFAAPLTLVALATFVYFVTPGIGAPLADFFADQYATDLSSGGITTAQRDELMRAAAANTLKHRLPADGEVRAAHESTTYEQLMTALTGDYQSIEGDVGLADGVPVMRHDVRDPVGMTLRDWLAVVAAADFPIVKLDLKRDRLAEITSEISRAIRNQGLSEATLKLNADVLEGPGAYSDFDFGERIYARVVLKQEPEDMIGLVERFPRATFSIGAWLGPVPDGTTYGRDDINAVLDLAADLRAAGADRIVVAARWDLLTDEFVAAMATGGVTVDVWNSRNISVPDDVAEETARLRATYGDALGVIDLLPATAPE